MKIAMLSSDYLPIFGGIAAHIYELSKALVDAGHEVEVWFWNRKGKDVDINQCGDIPVRMFSTKNTGHLQGKELTAALVVEIQHCLNKFDAQVIHAHTLDNLIGAIKQVKKKYKGVAIWTNHTSRFHRKMTSFWWRLKFKFISSGFDGLIVPSKILLQKSRFLQRTIKHQYYVANGVDASKFTAIDQTKAREELELPKDTFILLSTGRFAPIKGLIYLIEALCQIQHTIPNILCLFCGNTPDAREWPKIAKMVKDEQLEPFVKFAGAVPNSAIKTYISAADVVMLPSLMEGSSISALEAMAASRPLIATSVGGNPELIDEGKNGFLVPPADSQALAKSIIKIHQASNRKQMGQYAREKIKQGYVWEIIATKVNKIYQDCGA